MDETVFSRFFHHFNILVFVSDAACAPTCGHDESWCGVLGQDWHPPQLDVEQLAPALGQVQRATFTELEGKTRRGSPD